MTTVKELKDHLDELERQGLVKRPLRPLDESFLSIPRPHAEQGASLVDAVIEERRP